MGIFVVAILLGLIPVIIAQQKGRSFFCILDIRCTGIYSCSATCIANESDCKNFG